MWFHVPATLCATQAHSPRGKEMHVIQLLSTLLATKSAATAVITLVWITELSMRWRRWDKSCTTPRQSATPCHRRRRRRASKTREESFCGPTKRVGGYVLLLLLLLYTTPPPSRVPPHPRVVHLPFLQSPARTLEN